MNTIKEKIKNKKEKLYSIYNTLDNNIVYLDDFEYTLIINISIENFLKNMFISFVIKQECNIDEYIKNKYIKNTIIAINDINRYKTKNSDMSDIIRKFDYMRVSYILNDYWNYIKDKIISSDVSLFIEQKNKYFASELKHMLNVEDYISFFAKQLL